MINIFEDLEKGQIIESDHTGNQYKIVDISGDKITLLRGGNEILEDKQEVRETFSFTSPADY